MLNRRRLITTSIATVAGLAVGNAARAAVNGLRVTRHKIPWPVDKRFRVVQVTDVHVGWGTPKRVLREVAAIVHKAKPSATVLTGDYVNHSLHHVDRVQEFVTSLPGPKFATLGNHDHWAGAGGVVDALRGGGAQLLENQSVDIGGLILSGVDDGHTKHHDPERALKGIDPSSAVIVSHFPNTADHIAKLGGKLILSGHTHGGQVVVPGLTKLLVRTAGLPYMSGWYEVGGGRLYVNAGCGQSVEGIRVGKRAMPEVAIFDFFPAAP